MHRRCVAKKTGGFHNRSVPERARRLSSDSARRRARISDPARIQDLFLARLDELERRVAAELVRPVPARGPLAALAGDLGREGLRLAAYAATRLLRPGDLVSALGLALAARPCDVFGIDRSLVTTVRELLPPLARLWLGIDRTPLPELPSGGVLVTFNRSAWPLPVEAVALWLAIGSRLGDERLVCALWEPWTLELPLAGTALGRIGIFAASRENVRLLLERGAVVVAFPEGRAAREKTYERRYRLTRFEDDFLISAAIETGATILPGAVAGNEESFPVVGTTGGWPITPVFPLAGLLGTVPLPLRWRVKVGAAVEYPAGDEACDHAAGVADAVRARMQAMLGELLATRRRSESGG